LNADRNREGCQTLLCKVPAIPPLARPAPPVPPAPPVAPAPAPAPPPTHPHAHPSDPLAAEEPVAAAGWSWVGPNYQDDQGVNKFIQSFIETNWLTDDDDDAMLPKRWS